jgi:hypothetical protein
MPILQGMHWRTSLFEYRIQHKRIQNDYNLAIVSMLGSVFSYAVFSYAFLSPVVYPLQHVVKCSIYINK